MRQAELGWDQIDRILLVGGSTRMPMVAAMLSDLSGRPIDRSMSPDESVAHGAALYADLLLAKRGSGSGKSSFSVTNINSHSLGIVGINSKTKQRINKVIIPKNTSLPISATKRFKTFRQGQRNVSIRVLEGESPQPDGCTQVGTCTIRNLPPDLEAGWPVEVTYHYAENGKLDVSARLEGRDAAVTTTFVRDNTLPEGDLLLWAEYVANNTSEFEL